MAMEEQYLTNDDDLAELIRSIALHGKAAHATIIIRIGINSRLDTIQAAVLQVKFQAFIDVSWSRSTVLHSLYGSL
jgi:dTDP-4-amino-4,6-dideoxygalactose transaminase